jgi:hypothetical protein
MTRTVSNVEADQRLTAQINVDNNKVRDKIQVIQRPKGEAGDRKNGFILIAAMQLDKGKENRKMYNDILVRVWIALPVNVSPP